MRFIEWKICLLLENLSLVVGFVVWISIVNPNAKEWMNEISDQFVVEKRKVSHCEGR